MSLGIQDFATDVQLAINRLQPFRLVQQLMDEARKMGFREINFDLIYGLPQQTIESVCKTVAQVVALRPNRIAFYSYAHVPHLKPAQRRLAHNLPSSAEKRELFARGRERLLAAGYIEIGMDHFAEPSDSLTCAVAERRLHRNFMGYTNEKNLPLLAFGVSSIGETRSAYMQNEKDINRYMTALEAGRLPLLKGHFITEVDQQIKSIIFGLLTRFEYEFAEGFEAELLQRKRPVLQSFLFDGLLTLAGRHLRVTPLGRGFIRNICMVFDSYLQSQSGTQSVPQFSRSV